MTHVLVVPNSVCGSEKHYKLTVFCSKLRVDCDAYSEYMFYCDERKKEIKEPNTTCKKCKTYTDGQLDWMAFAKRIYMSEDIKTEE